MMKGQNDRNNINKSSKRMYGEKGHLLLYWISMEKKILSVLALL